MIRSFAAAALIVFGVLFALALIVEHEEAADEAYRAQVMQ